MWERTGVDRPDVFGSLAPMQLFSLATLFALTAETAPKVSDAASVLSDFEKLRAETHIGLGIAWLLISQAIAIVAYWLSSKIVASEASRFTNAVKLWIFYILAFAGCAALFAFGIAIGGAQQSASMLFATAVVGLLLIPVTIFGLPMKVYDLSLGGSIVFIILTMIISAGANLGVSRLVPAPVDFREHIQLGERLVKLPASERRKLFARFQKRREEAKATTSTAAPSDDAIAADRTRTIAERHAAIQRIYRDLEARRAAIKPGDTTALNAYTKDEQRYQQLLQQLQADNAASAR